MGRGILTGVIWGAIVGFGILTLANEIAAPVSVGSLTPPVDSPAPMESPSSEEMPAERPVAEEAPESAPEASEPMEAPETSTETADPAPEPDMAPEMAPDMTPEAEPTVPSVDTVPEVLDTPAETETLGDVVAPNPSPVLTPPETMPPAAAEADAKPEVEGAMPEATDPDMDTPETESGEALPETVLPDADETPDTSAMMPDMSDAPAALPGQSSGGLGQKVGSFTDREDSRVSSRLPSIAAAENSAASEDAAPVVVADDLPALLAYSADYTATPTGPIMSVILVDIAALGPNDRALTQLPFPVTFAVDAFATGADERAMDYRSKGMEVLAMIGLPEGATPQDAATTISQAAELVPVSIGFLDVPSASFQSSRQVAAQVVASAQDTGRGVVTFPRGLNSLEQEAQRAKAPSALVLRDFDGEGQDVAAMKRFIEHAALQASSGKTVVLLGRSKPDTIQALAEWSLGNRAATVSIVPLSYLLSRSRL